MLFSERRTEAEANGDEGAAFRWVEHLGDSFSDFSLQTRLRTSRYLHLLAH